MGGIDMLARSFAVFRLPTVSTPWFLVRFDLLRRLRTVFVIALFSAFPVLGMAQSVKSLVVAPTSIAGGAGVTGTITLSSVAGANGLSVSVLSDQPCVQAKSPVAIPAGKSSVKMSFTTSVVTSTTSAVVMAYANGTLAYASLVVHPPQLKSISLVPSSLVGGGTIAGDVSIASPAPAGGLLVFLGETDPSVQVPLTVTIPSGATSVGFSATTTPVQQVTNSKILAFTDSGSIAANVKLTPPSFKMSLSPSSLLPGAKAIGTITLSTPAPTGGTQVQLASANALATVPAKITVPAGATAATFSATATQPPASGSVVISASIGQSKATETLTVIGGLATSAWPKFHGDLQSTGHSQGKPAAGVIKWQLHVPYADFAGSSPVLGSDGTIYLGASGDHQLYAINGSTGTIKWKFLPNDAINSTPAVGANGLVYFGSDDFNLYALNASTGAVKWKYMTGGYVQGSPTIGSDGTVYFGSNDGNIYALDGKSGAVKWSYPTGGIVRSCPTIGYDGTIYFGSTDYYVYAVNGATGALRWKSRVQNYVTDTITVDPSGSIYLGSWDFNVYSLNAATGAVNWNLATGLYVTGSPAAGASGMVYCGSIDHSFYAMDSLTGAQRWTFLTGNSIDCSPAIAPDGTVYIGSGDGWFYALNGTTGEVEWKIDTGGGVIPSPAIDADGVIYVAGGDYITAIN